MKIEKIAPVTPDADMQLPISFVPAGFIGIRTPALGPRAWQDYVGQGRDANGNFCLQSLAGAARMLFEQPALQEAFWLASAGLHARLAQWSWDVGTEHGRKLLQAFDRYFNRMCFRSTPFGTFAGFSHATLVPAAEAPAFASSLLSDVALRRAYYLDAELVFHIAHQGRHVAPYAWRYTVNASAYVRGACIRYTDWKQGKFGSRSYSSAEVAHDARLDALLFAEHAGDIDHTGWVTQAAQVYQCTDADAAEIIDQLISARLLLPFPGPDFLTYHPVQHSVQSLPQVQQLAHLRERLGGALETLARLPTLLPLPVTQYRAQQEFFSSLLSADIQTNSCLQVDAFRDLPVKTFNDQAWCAFARRISELYSRFGYRNNGLDAFADYFKQRHEREFVRLIDVLDDEELETEAFNFDPVPPATPGSFERLVLRRMIDNGSTSVPVKLCFDDIFQFPSDTDASDMLDIFAIAEHVTIKGDAPRFELIDLLSNNSVRWLTRFAHGDAELEASLRGLARQVAALDPDLVQLEVAYIPAARMGNVMRRPLLWDYVLDLAERTDNPNTLAVADLWLGMGENGLELWSAKLNRAVMPHVTSAHNPKHNGNTRLYKFLRAYERQNKWIFDAKLGDILGHADHSPRIEYEDVLIAPAMWRLKAADVGSEAALRDVLAQRNVPQVFKLLSGDNSLVIDSAQPLGLQQLYRSIQQEGQADLREYFVPTAGTTGQPVNHEVIVPLLRQDARPLARRLRRDFSLAQANLQQPDMPRLVSMQSMVYLKLYMAPSRLDAFLCRLGDEFLTMPAIAAVVDDWFFIRYSDPRHHVRLRLRCVAPHVGQLIENLLAWLQPLLKSRELDQYSFEQYQPEYTRYGGPVTTALSETLFGIDSVLAVRLLGAHDSNGRTVPAWQRMIYAVDRLRCDAGIANHQAAALMAPLAEAFMREFQAVRHNKVQLNAAYRERAAIISAIVVAGAATPAWVTGLDQASTVQRRQRRELFVVCRQDYARQGRPEEFEPFLRSHIHMACNRLATASRRVELNVYTYLAKAFYSLHVRATQSTEPTPRSTHAVI
jgi:lantibiotic biosynthesis protein